MTTLPTWLVVMLGLAGPVVALVAIGAEAFREWQRFKREDRYRDYAERRQVYLEFLVRWHSYEDARTREPRNKEEFEKANLAFQRSFNALSLIAPEEVRAAADAIRQEEVPGRRQEASGAPGRFWKAARKDLGKPA